MNATLLKTTTRNTSKCDAGHRRQTVAVNQLIWVCRLNRSSALDVLRSEILIGDYRLELTVSNVEALRDRFNDILAEK